MRYGTLFAPLCVLAIVSLGSVPVSAAISSTHLCGTKDCPPIIESEIEEYIDPPPQTLVTRDAKGALAGGEIGHEDKRYRHASASRKSPRRRGM
jgi:hypothetical protein